MSRRIEIELTSARPDGVWTWRAAGAREPRGTVDPTVLPPAAKVGDVLKVDADFELDGIAILGVAGVPRARREAERIELLANDKSFEPVTQTLARGDRGDRGDRPRRDRSDRPRRDGPGDRPRPDGDRPRGDRRDGPARGPRPDGDRPRSDRPGGDRPERSGSDRPRSDRPSRPRFEPVPELPQRPRAKRLKPMRTHRNVVLADLPEAERAIADKALQGGIPAVRTAVAEQNAQLRSQGKEEVPAAGLLKMAEELLPRLRVAEWLDRAEAAKADIDELDLRDLRSVVVGADDPMVARDETTRAIAAELKAALLTRQEQASAEWLEDISMAVEVGRVIRALKLSSEPPKAGMRFPTDLAARLAGAATASLAADALPERWSAVLEAAAFSPIRAQIAPAAPPTQVNDELTATITRLAAAVPQIAALFGITVAPGTQAPKPLRPTRKPDGRKGPGAPTAGPTNAQGRPLPPKPLPPKPLPPKPVAVAPTVESPVIESDSAEPPVIESPVIESPVIESPVIESPVIESPVIESGAVESSVIESPVIESPVIESPVIESPVIESGSAETEAAPPVVEVVALEAEAVTGDAADAEDDSPGVEAGSDEVEAETTDEADSIEATDAADEATEAASIEVTDAADEVSETIDGIAADAADSEQVADAS